MQEKEIGQIIDKYIIENFVLNPDDKPSPQESLLEAGIIDSTSVLTLVMFLEEKFGIAVEDDELVPDNLDSMEKISAFVSRKLG